METSYATKKMFTKTSEPRLPRKALLETLDDRATVLHLYQKRPYTFLLLTTFYNDREYMGYGFSKVCYPDKWDDELGADIAKKRALYMIYHEIRSLEKGQDRSEAYQMLRNGE
jgi:hypothetical protein